MKRSRATKLFLDGVLLTGAIAFIATVARLSIAEPVKFACYCALTLIAAGLKNSSGVSFPGLERSERSSSLAISVT